MFMKWPRASGPKPDVLNLTWHIGATLKITGDFPARFVRIDHIVFIFCASYPLHMCVLNSFHYCCWTSWPCASHNFATLREHTVVLLTVNAISPGLGASKWAWYNKSAQQPAPLQLSGRCASFGAKTGSGVGECRKWKMVSFNPSIAKSVVRKLFV